MKEWIITIFAVLLSGVLLFIFWGDEQKLGDNYYYLPKYEAIDVGYPGGGIIYKSSQKYFYEDIKVHGNVMEVNANKDFIIAIQNADTSYIEKTHTSIAENNYFIIVKKTNLVYGPYNNKDYLQKREELGIPDKLELEKQ